MSTKRISAPIDLMAELNDEPPDLKKQTTTVTAPAQTAPPSKAKTTVQPPSAPQKTIPPRKTIATQKTAPQKTIAAAKPKPVPPRKSYGGHPPHAETAAAADGQRLRVPQP